MWQFESVQVYECSEQGEKADGQFFEYVWFVLTLCEIIW